MTFTSGMAKANTLYPILEAQQLQNIINVCKSDRKIYLKNCLKISFIYIYIYFLLLLRKTIDLIFAVLFLSIS